MSMKLNVFSVPVNNTVQPAASGFSGLKEILIVVFTSPNEEPFLEQTIRTKKATAAGEKFYKVVRA